MLSPSSPPAPGRGPAPRAEAHSASARLHPLAELLVLATLGALTGCSPESDVVGGRGAERTAASPAASIQALLDAYEPVPLEATSDKHDAALARRRQILEDLRRGDRDLGLAALAAFRAQADARDEVRSALLEVAAVCDPEGLAPVLERMVLNYDVELGLGLRTRAAELLAETSPAAAMQLLGPLVTGAGWNITMPPREVLVRAWAEAARSTESKDLGVLVDAAVDISQAPDTRYAAIDELGSFGGELASKALEEVLFEGSSDAYLRRKAAQGLESLLAPAQLCPLLERAGAHEHDEVFAQFLSSMMARNCP